MKYTKKILWIVLSIFLLTLIVVNIKPESFASVTFLDDSPASFIGTEDKKDLILPENNETEKPAKTLENLSETKVYHENLTVKLISARKPVYKTEGSGSKIKELDTDDNENTDKTEFTPEVPEFSVLAAIAVLIGASLVIIRKR